MAALAHRLARALLWLLLAVGVVLVVVRPLTGMVVMLGWAVLRCAVLTRPSAPRAVVPPARVAVPPALLERPADRAA